MTYKCFFLRLCQPVNSPWARQNFCTEAQTLVINSYHAFSCSPISEVYEERRVPILHVKLKHNCTLKDIKIFLHIDGLQTLFYAVLARSAECCMLITTCMLRLAPLYEQLTE